MKLLTQEIINKLPKLYSTENIPVEQKKAVVKFFTPDSNWTWYAVEGEKQENGDYLFYGLVEGFEREWGYFVLSELEQARGKMGMPIERDLYFNGEIK